MQLLKIININIISQILKYKWYKVSKFIHENTYVHNDYKPVKVCTRENNGRQCTETIIEFVFVWWNYRFFQVSRSVLNSIYNFWKLISIFKDL